MITMKKINTRMIIAKIQTKIMMKIKKMKMLLNKILKITVMMNSQIKNKELGSLKIKVIQNLT